MAKYLLLILTVGSMVMMSSCSDSDDDDDTNGNWVKLSDYEGNTRTGAVSFTIGEFAYVGLGTDGDDYLKDFWRYDQSRNFWEEMASFPGEGRISAVAFSADGKGYVGTGFNEDLETEELGDFWSYDPNTNSWTEVAPFGGSARYSAVSFSINDEGYVGTGFDGNYLKDFWKYDPASNSWEQVVSLFGSKRESALAFVIDGVAYVGTGRNNGSLLYDFWSYRPGTDEWVDLSIDDDDDDSYDQFNAAMARYDAVAFVMDGMAYISTGINDSYLSSVYSFDPSSNVWLDEYTGFEGTSRGGAVSFTINEQGYITTGRSSAQRHDDIWSFQPLDEYDQFD